MPSPFSLVSALWLLLPFCVGAFFWSSTDVRRVLSDDRKILFLVAVAAAVVLVPVYADAFYGLEYEDAFEYSYSGHLLAANDSAKTESLNPICLIGTRWTCYASGSLSHPIGLSVLVSWLVEIGGESSRYMKWISIIALLLSALACFMISRIMGSNRIGAAAASLLILTTPAFYSLSGTGLAEPTSSAVVALALLVGIDVWSSIEAGRANATRLVSGAVALAALFAVAITLKRENMVLPLAMACGAVLTAGRSRSEPPTRKWRAAAVVLASAVLGIAVSVFAIGEHLLDLSVVRPGTAHAFSFKNFVALAPEYVLHLLSPARFFLLAYLAILGAAFGLRRLTLIAVPILVILGYSLVICAFGHDYYFVSSGEVPYFHFERHLLSAACAMSVLGGFGLQRLVEKASSLLEKRKRILSIGAVACVGIAPLIWAVGHRNTLAAEEQDIRQRPVEEACRVLRTGSMVVTAEPILVTMFCSKRVTVVDIHALERSHLAKRVRSAASNGTLHWFRGLRHEGTDRKRYPIAFKMLEELQVKKEWRFVINKDVYLLSRYSDK